MLRGMESVDDRLDCFFFSLTFDSQNDPHHQFQWRAYILSFTLQLKNFETTNFNNYYFTQFIHGKETKIKTNRLKLKCK